MKKTKKLSYIIMAIIIVIIIAGAIVCGIKGFNIELLYSSRQEIVLSSGIELDESSIKEIAESILGDKKVEVLEVERFGNAVEIISTEITEEEKESIISKINEEYDADISNDDIDIISVPNTRIRDILKPYILPGVITLIAVLIYFMIMYHKMNLSKILLKSICAPIIVELTYYAIIAITRVPFGRVVNSIAIGLYVITICVLSVYFQRGDLSKNDKKENDE